MIDPTSTAIHGALSTLLHELIDGSATDACWILNPKDPGLLRSLDKLSATAASVVPPGGGSSIAAHVDHLRYGLELLNRWSRGENPFADADYSASWRRLAVSDREWALLRDQLRAEAHKWLEAVRQPRELSDVELRGILASVAHLAYHLGAIRQIDRSTRGPLARD
ncbi:MAG: DinB family protein [Nitrospiraceae bacterium]|nr:DinB family protein [Nitrospiraceae bacterium]